MSNYSLLVADDEEIPRRHILEDISWDTLNIRPLYQASTGWEALALLLKHQPDILILDIRMPGLSGLQLPGRAGPPAQLYKGHHIERLQ